MMFRLKKIELSDILAEREERQRRRDLAIRGYGTPAVTISMNIAGEIKSTPAILLLFNRAVELFKAAVGEPPLYEEIRKPFTGPSALLVYDMDPALLKEAAMAVEAASPSGRLSDIDVIGADGVKLSRPVARTCVVCGGSVSLCARDRAHGLDAIRKATDALILPVLADAVADAACYALEEEVRLTPKPGLVDSENSGAHSDMDLELMLRSARTLRPYFREMALSSPGDMDALVRIGKEAEKAMFAATGGVNTHKGAIYSLGLIAAAYADCAMNGGDPCEKISALARKRRDMRKTEEEYLSHGNSVRKAYNAGAENEALKGLKFARSAARKIGINPLLAMCFIMSGLDDTNLLYRGGEEALSFVKDEAGRLLSAGPEELENGLKRMDELCISRGISPGGSADMLACAYMMYRLDALFS